MKLKLIFLHIDINHKISICLKIQAKAELDVQKNWIPRTEGAIRKRNAGGF